MFGRQMYREMFCLEATPPIPAMMGSVLTEANLGLSGIIWLADGLTAEVAEMSQPATLTFLGI